MEKNRTASVSVYLIVYMLFLFTKEYKTSYVTDKDEVIVDRH